MDGAIPAPAGGLPPINQPQQQPMYQQPRPVIGQPAPVGRPLGDPDAQEAKVQRSAERRRLESVLPKQATDSKIHVFKLKGSRVPPGARPVVIILASALEEARQGGTEPDDFIAQKLSEKYTDGRFQCVAIDRTGKRVNDVQPWEIALGRDAEIDEDDEELDDDDLDDEDIPSFPGIQGQPFANNGGMPQFQAPPAPPALDLTSIAGSFRAERNDEARRSTEMMSIMTTMMSASQQQQAIQIQQQQQRDEQARRDAQEREERYRREDREREERAEKRRSEFRTTLMALTPILLPVVEKLFGLNKPAPGIDPTTTLLLEMVKQKSPDTDILKQTASLMGEMTKQQMQLQGAGAQAAVTMQAEASQMVFANMMKTMKEMMENKPASEKEESTLEQVAKLASAIIPALQQGQQQPATYDPAPQQVAPQQQQIPQQRQNPPVVEATVDHAPVRKRQPPRQQRPPQQPVVPPTAPGADAAAEYSEAQRINGVIHTIRRLSLAGEENIPAEKRWAVLEWATGMLPPDVIQIIATKDKDAVIERCHVSVLSQPKLLAWLGDAENVQFLEDALNDLKALVLNAATDDLKARAIEANRTFVQRRIDVATSSVGATVAATTTDVAKQAPPAAPIAGPGSTTRTRGKRMPPPPAAEKKDDAPKTET